MSTPVARRVVVDAAEFGRVAVMLGGYSSERAVSLDTGTAVLAALHERGVDASPWDPAERDLRAFAGAGFERVFIALHGAGGEDGTLQGALQWLKLPYTGSGVMASAVSMDKIRSKLLFRASGIPTPDFRVFERATEARSAADALGYPLVVKPSREGSSVGMSIISEPAAVDAAAELALGYEAPALMETCIVGKEMTVAVLNGKALPSIRIETPREFYDYRAKYQSERTRYLCPGSDDAADEARYAELAERAFDVLGCSGWGRVDFMVGHDGEPFVLEVNTVPGMTSHSLVPMAARQAGLDFAELCWRILETSVPGTVSHNVAEVAANGA